MPDLETNAAYWWERAEETRAKATLAVPPIRRESLMDVAETYERMAKLAERATKRLTLERTPRD